MPKGTPAVTTRRWPDSAISSRWAMRQALSTISEKVRTSRVLTQWMPQAIARRRAVSSFEVRHRIGTSGRSRAARSAVEPEVV